MINLDRANTIPLTDQIVQQLAGLIQSGQLPGGSRLPSIRKLAATLSVSSATVVAAYDRLTARGLIASRAASGFFVEARSERLNTPHVLPSRRDNIDGIWLMRRMLDARPGMLPAGNGFMPEAWLEDTISARLLARIARHGRRSYTTPGSAEGYAPLRQQLALKCNQAGIPAHPEQILTTFGVTQAFDIILRTLLSPGDTVAVEEPCYFGLTAQLQAYGIRMIPIPRGHDGPDLAVLEEACLHFRPRLFFTQTLMHNPTGTNTEVGVAARLVQLAERHNLLLVEDDVHGDFHPQANPVRLAQLDKLQRVIFVSSFSKTLSPNIRVGYIAAPVALYEAFLEHKLLSVLTSSELDELLVHEVLAEGNYRKHVERVRQRLARQWPGLVRGLQASGLTVVGGEQAGVFAWCRLPEEIDEEVLLRDAAENGIQLAPGRVFHLNPAPPHLRFSTATANDARLFDYLKTRLASLRTQAQAAAKTPLSAS
ncbi:MAG TPA: PLP-dependent aminotransferase family protein [Roseateles sp.]|nr:PLP-dependent aminotransferase family protein [Roseateles sp.]HWT53194.1 PLP-dependent aminotransferase family protein [Rhodocyclaceae bacterium]